MASSEPKEERVSSSNTDSDTEANVSGKDGRALCEITAQDTKVIIDRLTTHRDFDDKWLGLRAELEAIWKRTERTFVARVLTTWRADFETDNRGWTCLHYAAYAGDARELLLLLIHQGL